MKCKKCNSENPDNALFCRVCGYKLNENSKLFLSPIENSILVYLTKEKLQVKILDECLFESLTWYYVDLPTTSSINCRGWVNKNNFSMLCNDMKNIPDNL